ncbi:MAG: carboxypeptidase regulatory-like domain-containing protein [Kofleriaceae bacterium]
MPAPVAEHPHVACALHGTITNVITRAPLAGATITVDDDKAKTTSRDDGSYELCDLSVALHRIDVVADGFALQMHPIGVDGDLKRDFVLTPEAIVSGRVIDAATKRPIAGATATLSLDERRTTVTVKTDAFGRFTAHHVAPGRFSAHAFAGDQFSPKSVFGAVAIGQRLELAEPIEVAMIVVPKPVAGPPATIVGHTTKQHAPIGNVDIDAGWARTTSAADGSYTLSLPGGSYEITARIENVAYASGVGYFELAPGQTRTLDFDLDHFAAVHGVVVDGAGNPVRGVRVLAENPDQSEQRRGVTRYDGTFVVGGFTGGVYEVEIDDRHDQTLKKLTVTGSDAGTVHVSPGTGVIRGHVVDPDGKPAVDVVVELDREIATTTDRDGAFTFSGLANRMYDASAFYIGGSDHPKVKPGDTIVIHGQRPGTLELHFEGFPKPVPFTITSSTWTTSGVGDTTYAAIDVAAYRIDVKADEAPFEIAFAVKPGATTKAVIKPALTGSLEVHVAPAHDVLCQLDAVADPRANVIDSTGALRWDQIAVGEVTVMCQPSTGGDLVQKKVKVLPGAVVRVDLAVP